MRGRVKSVEIVEHGRVGLVIVVVVVVVVRGGVGRRTAVDEGGVDHRQVVADREHADVCVGTHSLQRGSHPVEGKRQTGTELELCAIARAHKRGATQRRQPATQRPPDGPPRAEPGRVAVSRQAARLIIRQRHRGRGPLPMPAEATAELHETADRQVRPLGIAQGVEVAVQHERVMERQEVVDTARGEQAAKVVQSGVQAEGASTETTLRGGEVCAGLQGNKQPPVLAATRPSSSWSSSARAGRGEDGGPCALALASSASDVHDRLELMPKEFHMASTVDENKLSQRQLWQTLSEDNANQRQVSVLKAMLQAVVLPPAAVAQANRDLVLKPVGPLRSSRCYAPEQGVRLLRAALALLPRHDAQIVLLQRPLRMALAEARRGMCSWRQHEAEERWLVNELRQTGAAGWRQLTAVLTLSFPIPLPYWLQISRATLLPAIAPLPRRVHAPVTPSREPLRVAGDLMPASRTRAASHPA